MLYNNINMRTKQTVLDRFNNNVNIMNGYVYVLLYSRNTVIVRDTQTYITSIVILDNFTYEDLIKHINPKSKTKIRKLFDTLTLETDFETINVSSNELSELYSLIYDSSLSSSYYKLMFDLFIKVFINK